MANRMDTLSRNNIKAADRVEIVELTDGMVSLGYGLKVWKGERVAFVHTGADVACWPRPVDARRALRRVRQDLEPTLFQAERAAA